MTRKSQIYDDVTFKQKLDPLSLQEELAPCASLRGSSTGVVARVESLRGRMFEAGRQVVNELQKYSYEV